MKRPASLKGTYSVNKQQHKCLGTKDCLMMIDIGRGVWPYGSAYFWVLLMTKLEDGRDLFLTFSDGIGSESKSLEKASEDFVVLGGQHYKMDIAQLDYYKDNYFTKKVIRTAEND